MDFRSLTYFITVAGELNITKAAALLNMSQPPLSSQIRQLEEELGTQLFIRSKKGLTLTPAGTILLKRAQQILELAEHTRQEISNYETFLSGELRIGVVEGRAPFLLSRWIRGFSEEFPLVTYTVRSGSSDDLLDQLSHHLLDLAVIAAPYNPELLHGITVGRTPWVAIIPREHPLALAEGNEVRLEELADVPLIIPERTFRVTAIEHWFSQKKLSPRICCKTSHYVDAVSLVEQGVGVCIFPQSTYTPNPHVSVKLITQPAKYAEYVLVSSRGSVISDLADAFRDYVKDFLEENRMQSARFRLREAELTLPEDADLL